MGQALKLLHTSDWHLGKRLYRLERLPEQELFLEELIGIIKQEQVNHLIVAGDVFDSPQPPHRAIKLLYDFIARLLQETSAELWLLAGNHDSGALLEAPLNLVNQQRIHIFGTLRPTPHEHWTRLSLPNMSSYIDLCLLPYFRQHEITLWNGDKHSIDSDWLSKILQQALTPPGKQDSIAKIFVGHHLFGLYEAAGSEQALALSGIDTIPLDWLSAFDYAALGHIHKPQTLRKHQPLVRYSGSPLPMRFTETQPKGVELITVTQNGWEHRTIPLSIYRTIRSVRVSQDNWQAVLNELRSERGLKPAVEIILQLAEPVAGLIDEIKQYADFLEILNIIPAIQEAQAEPTDQGWIRMLELSPLEIFSQFYLSKYPTALEVPPELVQDISQLWQEANHASSSTQD